MVVNVLVFSILHGKPTAEEKKYPLLSRISSKKIQANLSMGVTLRLHPPII